MTRFKDLLGNLFLRNEKTGPTSLNLAGLARAEHAAPAPTVRNVGAIAETVYSHPHEAQAHTQLGNTLLAKGELDGAIVAYREALRIQPNLAYAHFNLGNALRLKGRLDEAIIEWRETIRCQPGLAVAHNCIGMALVFKRDLDGAVASLREAIRLQPNYADAHDNLGTALACKGELEGAIASHSEAIRLQPNHVNAQANFGNALLVKGDLEGAIAAYRQALRLQPKHANAHFGLGNALEKNGDQEAALAEYHQACTLAPTVPAYRSAYDKLLRQLKSDGPAPNVLDLQNTETAQHAAAGPAGPSHLVAPGRQIPEGTYKNGSLIGEFQVHRLLGRGGFGEVYLVSSRKTRQILALKTFLQKFLADDEVKTTFKKEALLWVNLEAHPCILTARFVQLFYGNLFVAMDYIAPDERGRVTLADHLRQSRGPIDTDQVLTWGIHFCYGMEHANAHGIKCHRDVKPANILIRQDRQLMISDFGLAAAAESAGKQTGDGWSSGMEESTVALSLFQAGEKMLCGTPGYIAPELFEGSEADVRGDIYSFGLVLWQMAAGSQLPPFAIGLTPRNRDYAFDINERQKRQRVPVVAGVLQGIIERCLALNPSERFANFTELRAALEPILKSRCGQTVVLPRNEERSAAYWYNRSVSLKALGHLEEAIDCLNRALEIAPDSASSHRLLGQALDANGKLDRAMVEFRTALQLQPDNADTHNDLGRALLAKGDLDGAVSEIREAIRLHPSHVFAHVSLGNVLLAKGDREGSAAAYSEAVRLDPSNVALRLFLPTARKLSGGRPGLGLELRAQREAVRLTPNDASAHIGLGIALQDSGDLDRAIASFHKALELQPDNAFAHNNLGQALQEKGDFDGTIAEFRETVRLQPRNASNYYSLGKALEDAADLDGAIAAFGTAVGLQPDNAIAHYNLGEVLREKGDLDRAVASYRTAVRLQPSNVHHRTTLGQALQAKGNLEGAIVAYREAIRLQPDAPHAHYGLADALAKTGNHQAALEEYAKAHTLVPNIPKYRHAYQRLRQQLKSSAILWLA